MKKRIWMSAWVMAAAVLGAAALGGCSQSETQGTASQDSGSQEKTSAADGQQDLLAQIQEKGFVTIAMEGTWAPWTYHDENDNLVGYDVEV